MQNAPERMNKTATCSPTRAKSVQTDSLLVLAQHLIRLKPTCPPLARDFLTVLEWQCRNFERNPEMMRPRMLWTIKKIREKAGLTPETAA